MNKKKIMIIALVVVVLVFIVGMITVGKQSAYQGPVVSLADIVTLEESEFVKEIKETGMVESNSSSQVYTRQSYPVVEINVAVGDEVKAGDVLAQLDTQDLEEQIASKKLEIAQSSDSSSLQVSQAQRKYEEEKKAVEDETNSSIVSAKQALDNATRTMLNANETYAESGGNDQLEQEAVNAQYNYLQAVENYELSLVNANKGLETYKDSLDTALESSNQDVTLMSLDNLEKSLEETVIMAPVDGTITAVYAVEGSTPTGILFVIEDLDSLVVESSLSETDILNVWVGMPVGISLNNGSDEIYNGTVKKIAPTATKDASGNTSTGTSPMYTVEVELLESETPLLVGMNVKTDFILEQVEQALTVPIENIYQNKEGENCILLLEAVSEKVDTYLVKEVSVTMGSSDNFVQVVSGEEIISGMQILGNVEENQAYIGLEVVAVEEQIGRTGSGFMMMKGGM